MYLGKTAVFTAVQKFPFGNFSWLEFSRRKMISFISCRTLFTALRYNQNSPSLFMSIKPGKNTPLLLFSVVGEGYFEADTSLPSLVRVWQVFRVLPELYGANFSTTVRRFGVSRDWLMKLAKFGGLCGLSGPTAH